MRLNPISRPTLRAHALVLSLSLGLVSGVSACSDGSVRSGGSGDAVSPAPTTTDPPTSEPTTEPPAEPAFPDVPPLAQEEFRPAYLRLLRANAHRVVVEQVGASPDDRFVSVEGEGRFSISPVAMDLLVTQRNVTRIDPQAPDTLAFHTVIADRRTFFRPEGFDSPAGECWILTTGADLSEAEAEGMAPEAVAAATEPPTAASLIPLMLIDRYRPSDRTTSLGVALSLLGLGGRLRADPQLGAKRVPITIVVRGGTIVEAQLSAQDLGTALGDAIEALGLPAEYGLYATLVAESGPPGWRIGYRDAGEPVDIEAPTRLFDQVTRTCP
ncbi:hypothetical protein [Nocardioides sp.]|uniref:hypothetical protein n=1 Tax=Nocardioides sp. TaxID=35761 RepID=UPI003515B1F4